MLEKLLLLLLQAKSLGGAGLLLLSTGAFVVTGTIDGKPVDLRVSATEMRGCVEALLTRGDALLRVDAAFDEARGELRKMREGARDEARRLNRVIDESALGIAYREALVRLETEHAGARQRLFALVDLARCEDDDPNTGIVADLARLRESYDGIVLDAQKRTKAVLDAAQSVFDRLVQQAPPRPRSVTSGSSGTKSTGATSGH